MDLDVERLCGAGDGARTAERLNHRNGYRSRLWHARAGAVEPTTCPEAFDNGVRRRDPCPLGPSPAYRDNQTMKRSLSSSPLSLHHAQSLYTARWVCSGVLGICGLITAPVSKCVVTRASADFRAGL